MYVKCVKCKLKLSYEKVEYVYDKLEIINVIVDD